MANQATHLDGVFHALADPTRRAVLERLTRGSAAMTELARPFEMALPSFSQHLHVLEDSGLVQSQKAGRVRTYQLSPNGMRVAEHWMDRQRDLWERRLDRLDSHLVRLANLRKEQKR